MDALASNSTLAALDVSWNAMRTDTARVLAAALPSNGGLQVCVRVCVCVCASMSVYACTSVHACLCVCVRMSATHAHASTPCHPQLLIPPCTQLLVPQYLDLSHNGFSDMDAARIIKALADHGALSG